MSYKSLLQQYASNAQTILGDELFDTYVNASDEILSEEFTKPGNEKHRDNILDTLDILESIIKTFTPEDERNPHGEYYEPQQLLKMVQSVEFDMKNKCLECIQRNIK